MSNTPKSERKHIVFLGRRNAGKSSLVNAIAGQSLSIVSEIPGTTTDPVSKSMELLPFGPVVLVDTAGYDDDSVLGIKRIEKTYKALSTADFVVLVIAADDTVSMEDIQQMDFLKKEKLSFLVVRSKSDLMSLPFADETNAQLNLAPEYISIKDETSIESLKNKISVSIPEEIEPPLCSDLIRQGDIVILVTPIDLGAPKGRLILPQVQTIRESLDSSAVTIVVKDKELRAALAALNRNPALVICDSQAITRVAADTPIDVPLTTFSILMARYKGNLGIFVSGLKAFEQLKNGDKILIAESCTHHAQEDDIGKVKIPRWIRNHTKKQIGFEFSQGNDFPENVRDYKLIIHCGGCMLTRKAMLSRLKQASYQDIPIVNYGMIISYLHGAFPRAIEIFPEAMNVWQN